MKNATKTRPGLDYYVSGIERKDRVVLAKAITLIESTLPSDQELASRLIERIVPMTGRSIRVGITGAPGVGKSTFIESFGKHITEIGKKVAVLTIDPSSQRTKGSILGDKTRMEELSTNPNAFIRPSSSGDALGGVAHKTRESMLLCEAAGYDIILIETVGVGQSEVMVKSMTDFFLLLMLPGSGDELQGIKKGIMEMADMVVITKADGENLSKAKQSQTEFQHAIHLLYHQVTPWLPKVITASSVTFSGIPDVYNTIEEFVSQMTESGDFVRNRAEQNISYMHEFFNHLLKRELTSSPELQEKTQGLEELVLSNKLSPGEAGKRLMSLFVSAVQGRSS
jgi:LAO/AO transport system kinase